jgi:G3E family GTPase
VTPLPVTVLTGFLGAGKTTLLCRLLKQPHDARIALIINEIGIAGTEEVEVSESEFLELTQGCVCCVRAADLRAALEQIAARGDVDRIVIETTGVADPLALTFVLERPDLADLVRLDAVITVVDAANWERTRVAEWDAQVGAADLIVLSKLDLTAALELLLDVQRADRPASGPHAQHSGFEVVSITSDGSHDADALEDLLEELPPAVYRAKGVVRTASGWIGFHVVAGRVQVEPTRAPEHGQSRVVFLGRGLADPDLRAAFAATADPASAR